MFDLAYLENLNHLWREKVLTLSKSDIKYIEGRTDFRSTLQGFLTRDYYQRAKVIKQGEIVYGYAFQDWTNDVTKLKHDYPVWVLSSPSSEVNQNPTIYREIIKNIEDLKRKSDLLEEENKFLNLIKKPLSDAKMVELPSSINNTFLSEFFCINSYAKNIELGPMPITIKSYFSINTTSYV